MILENSDDRHGAGRNPDEPHKERMPLLTPGQKASGPPLNPRQHW